MPTCVPAALGSPLQSGWCTLFSNNSLNFFFFDVLFFFFPAKNTKAASSDISALC